jgi:PRC-barrel domain protein
VSAEERRDRFRELEGTYKDYTVYDQHYEKIGRVDDLFVDENDQPEYIGVKMGLLGMKSTLIPMEIARVNDRRKLIEVAVDKDTIKDAPTFDDEEEITPDHESRIYGHYGLERPGFQQGRGGYGDYYPSDKAHTVEDLGGSVDTEYGERKEEPLARPTEGTTSGEERYGTYSPSRSGETSRGYSGPAAGDTKPRRDLGGTDVPVRIGETRQAGAGEREPGSVRVYKRVRTRHE